ncbi:hypothetical protein Vretimale_2238 [Volvox reticuliferus]|uniref:Uncharacterized protein n=1 Tax=Volvox reticuliferus TaxID=1737510 RepID=A0A8J4D723_9CHLO|nr:hypothetical protein Vretifemale_4532 [Volvox reticuliferus]GIL96389.1 hypothetical protein Vretimale_2238 [Volvox reticuliferus]
MASGSGDVGLVVGDGRADTSVMPETSRRGPHTHAVDGVRDPPLLLDPRTPIHPTVPITAAETGPVGRAEQRGPFAALPRQGRFDDDGEVMKLAIPVPKLDIPLDMKQKNAERSIADTTRAYLRDIRMYLQLVRGGDRDAAKCLLIGNTLGGVAKTWYDQWTLAR